MNFRSLVYPKGTPKNSLRRRRLLRMDLEVGRSRSEVWTVGGVSTLGQGFLFGQREREIEIENH